MIAITGANGLLGNYVTKELVGIGHSVRAIIRNNASMDSLHPVQHLIEKAEADILDMPALLEALAGAKVVVHVAGLVSFHPANRNRLFQVNLQGTRNVVNACLRQGIPKLIHISSVAALGRAKKNLLVNEESKWTISSTNTHYAASKYEAEIEVFRGMEEGLEVSIVNPSVILAPLKNGRSSAQLFSYVAKEQWFYGDGNINYVDVRDVSKVIATLVRENWNGERFIVNAGSTPLINLLGEIALRLEKNKPFIRVPAGLAYLAALAEEWRSLATGKEPLLTRQSVKLLKENFYFDNNKVIEKLGFRFKTLSETLDWCCQELEGQVG
jgi:nucleoside-diphosphate-sugar epimerase